MPVAGFIGSAAIGAPVVTQVDWASLAPNEKSALISQAGQLKWIPDLRSPGQSQIVTPTFAPKQLFWSADSNSSVVLTQADELVFMTNFSTSPIAAGSWDLDRSVNNTPATGSARMLRGAGTRSGWAILAADNRGQTVLLAAKELKGGLFLASQTTPPAQILSFADPVAAVIAPSGSTAFVADRATLQVSVIQNLGTGPVASALVPADAFPNSPAGIALSQDGTRIFAVDRVDPVIRMFDTVSGTLLGELPTNVPVSSLTAFGPGLVQLVTASGTDKPFYFLETSDPPRVVFVPWGQ